MIQIINEFLAIFREILCSGHQFSFTFLRLHVYYRINDLSLEKAFSCFRVKGNPWLITPSHHPSFKHIPLWIPFCAHVSLFLSIYLFSRGTL